jgi:hypothetical protein
MKILPEVGRMYGRILPAVAPELGSDTAPGRYSV